MNKNMVILFFVVMLAAAGFYCYQQGYFNAEVAQVEQALTDICDPAQQDCSAVEEDLAV